MSYREHHYSSADGLRLYYREYGAGDRCVVCLPGLTRNCRDFEDLAEHLSDRYRVITPDLRGRGGSDRDPNFRNYNQAVYARDLLGLFDHLGVEQVDLIGTSLGGLMAMILADWAPERLRSVVLNDIGPEVSDEGVARILTYVGRLPPVASWQEAADQARMTIGLAFPDTDDAFWDRYARRMYREGPDGVPKLDCDPNVGEALRKAQGAIKVLTWLRKLGLKKRVAGLNIDPWDSFAAVSMPCLVLRGEMSDILSADTLGKMKAKKPDLVAVTVSNRGHAPGLDEPEAVQAIDDFLDGLASV